MVKQRERVETIGEGRVMSFPLVLACMWVCVCLCACVCACLCARAYVCVCVCVAVAEKNPLKYSKVLR